MRNIFLLIFDIICLPITLIRLFLIYFFGSRYGIDFLDVMMHAKSKYFNQLNSKLTIDVSDDDIRLSIYRSSKLEFDNNMKNDMSHDNSIDDTINNTNNIKTEKTCNDPIDIIICDYENNAVSDNTIVNILDNIPDNIKKQTFEKELTINSIPFIKKKNKYKQKQKHDEQLTGKMDEQIRKTLDFMSFDGDIDSISSEDNEEDEDDEDNQDNNTLSQ